MSITEPTALCLRDTATADPGDALVLRIDGELDAHSVADFRSRLAEAVDGTAGGGDVLLDLARLYRLDEAGLGAISEAAAALARAGRRLALASVRPRVREFLAFAGAEALVPVFPTPEQAAQHLRLGR